MSKKKQFNEMYQQLKANEATLDPRDLRMLEILRAEENKQMVARVFKNVGRNDPCPCGSGKKYKKCCRR